MALGAQINYAQDSVTGELYLVRKVFVDRLTGSNQSERFRLLLQRKIRAEGFVITNHEENADAILKGTLSLHKQKQHGDWFLTSKAVVRLESRRGNQLWYGGESLDQNLRFGRSEPVPKMAARIAKSLRNAWEGSLQASRDGRVEHVFLVWERSDKPLTLGERTKNELTEAELSKLKALGLNGNLKLAHTGIEGNGPSKLRVIIVMYQPSESIEFSLTRQSTMFIIQMEDRWITHPSPIPFSKNKLQIFPVAFDETGFTLDRDKSGTQFQFAFKWP